MDWSYKKLSQSSSLYIIIGSLSLFIFLLSFKPSEPYLSQFLICNQDTATQYCNGINGNTCEDSPPCTNSLPSSQVTSAPQDALTLSLVNTYLQLKSNKGQSQTLLSTTNGCTITSCASLTSNYSLCGNDDYYYCVFQNDQCKNIYCYKQFSEDEVNNDIYPWSTYAYLPFLLTLGPFAELYSYRFAILMGISGRVITRFLLLYGTTLLDMQLMQVTYALGTAAEDVFSAYIYYVVDPIHFQQVTSCVKASALIASVLAGVIGDILVVLCDVSLNALMIISAVSVCSGFVLGLFIINRQNQPTNITKDSFHFEAYRKGTPPVDPTVSMNPSNSYEFRPVAQSNEDSPVNESRRFQLEVPSNDEQPTVHQVQSIDHNTNPSRIKYFQSRWIMFITQLKFIQKTLECRPLRHMIGLWIGGNAIFTIFYGYEVSIYEELNGSNNWNGSVLSIMLIAGSIGAMLPTWSWVQRKSSEVMNPSRSQPMPAAANNNLLQDDEITLITSMSSTNFLQTTLSNSEDFQIAFKLILSSLLSAMCLLLSIIQWEIVATVSFLAIYFATWQYVNVIILTRFALQLKLIQFQQQEQEVLESTSTTEETKDPPDPPYAIAIVLLTACNVIVQIIIQSILFSSLQLDLRVACWVMVLMYIIVTGSYIMLTISWFGFNVIYSRCKHLSAR